MIVFVVVIFIGCFDMVEIMFGDCIFILGLLEVVCYWIFIVVSVVIVLFVFECLIGLFV